MTAVWNRADAPWQRNVSVLVWTPLLLLGPVLSLRSGWQLVGQLAILVVLLASAVVIGLTGGQDRRAHLALVALVPLVLAAVAGVSYADPQWLPTWILLGNAVPCVLRGRCLAAAIPLVVGGAALAAWFVEPHEASRSWTQAFVVLLATLANTAFTRLLETITELRRTRGQLARLAVSEERERMARDLHDLLGHTLSVMVVKAEAVRRLAAADPETAAAHAADIERVGRMALLDVRQAVDAMRAPSLAEELAGAREALAAAGIHATVTTERLELADDSSTALAWVLREAVTNVLRHSGADACTISLAERDGHTHLIVTDNGTGAPSTPPSRAGGLDGLRDRVAGVGGTLESGSGTSGFRLSARVPAAVT